MQEQRACAKDTAQFEELIRGMSTEELDRYTALLFEQGLWPHTLAGEPTKPKMQPETQAIINRYDRLDRPAQRAFSVLVEHMVDEGKSYEEARKAADRRFERERRFIEFQEKVGVKANCEIIDEEGCPPIELLAYADATGLSYDWLYIGRGEMFLS